MLLGDLIATFEDPAVAGETLVALGDLALTAQVFAAASESNLSAGEFAVQSIGRFVDGASDEEWLTLVGLMSKADNPGQVFLRRALSSAIVTAQERDPG